jgi:hypothetical protein
VLKLHGDRRGAIEQYKIAYRLDPQLQSARIELAAALIPLSSVGDGPGGRSVRRTR